MNFAGHPSSHNSPECRPDQLQQFSESDTRINRPIEKQRARPTRTRSDTHRFGLITSWHCDQAFSVFRYLVRGIRILYVGIGTVTETDLFKTSIILWVFCGTLHKNVPFLII